MRLRARKTFCFTPAAMTLDVVHVTVWPAAPQVQAVPVPLTKLSPAGSVSTTVTTPLVAAVPAVLFTVIVYTPLTPTVKLPVWVLVRVRSGETTTTHCEPTLLVRFVIPVTLAVALVLFACGQVPTVGLAAVVTSTVSVQLVAGLVI